MNYITSTELRTKTTELVEKLEAGEEVRLLHRSKVLGTIRPEHMDKKPLKTIEDTQKFFKDMRAIAKKVGKYTKSQRDVNYKKHMETKYGKFVF